MSVAKLEMHRWHTMRIVQVTPRRVGRKDSRAAVCTQEIKADETEELALILADLGMCRWQTTR